MSRPTPVAFQVPGQHQWACASGRRRSGTLVTDGHQSGRQSWDVVDQVVIGAIGTGGRTERRATGFPRKIPGVLGGGTS